MNLYTLCEKTEVEKAIVTTMPRKNIGTNVKCCRKKHFLGIRKGLNLGFKAGILGCHPRDNGHVTH